jgi:hypothetical protein
MFSGAPKLIVIITIIMLEKLSVVGFQMKNAVWHVQYFFMGSVDFWFL